VEYPDVVRFAEALRAARVPALLTYATLESSKPRRPELRIRVSWTANVTFQKVSDVNFAPRPSTGRPHQALRTSDRQPLGGKAGAPMMSSAI
jgi:hypothetical protein